MKKYSLALDRHLKFVFSFFFLFFLGVFLCSSRLDEFSVCETEEKEDGIDSLRDTKRSPVTDRDAAQHCTGSGYTRTPPGESRPATAPFGRRESAVNLCFSSPSSVAGVLLVGEEMY